MKIKKKGSRKYLGWNINNNVKLYIYILYLFKLNFT